MDSFVMIVRMERGVFYYVKGLGVVHLEGAKSHILLWFSVVKL